jgi:hypothetical protein
VQRLIPLPSWDNAIDPKSPTSSTPIDGIRVALRRSELDLLGLSGGGHRDGQRQHSILVTSMQTVAVQVLADAQSFGRTDLHVQVFEADPTEPEDNDERPDSAKARSSAGG